MLWRSYLYYEYYCGNYNNAKHVFYSAINKCPYSKVLWTDASADEERGDCERDRVLSEQGHFHKQQSVAGVRVFVEGSEVLRGVVE